MDLQTKVIDLDIVEKEMLTFEQVECPVIHSFGPGIYIREARLKAGSIAIGHHQKFEHMNIFLKGKVIMLNEDGSKIELSAPMMFTGKPGRKVGYIVEDVVWLNIYATTETDIEKLEATYLEKSEGWKENNAKIKKLRRQIDIDDYKKLISEMGLTESDVRKQTENEDDQIPMPYGSFKIAISKSNIEGQGVFATANIYPHEIIAPAKLGDKRTPVGRFTNHSITPNAKMELIGNNIYLVALSEITGCIGGYLGDEITTNYRENIKLVRSLLCHQ